MERNTVQGPNNIGIAAERLEKILSNLANRGERSGNGRRPGGFNRNRSGGNRSNSSSGGGYRGNNERSGSGERSRGGGDRGGTERGERSRSFSGHKPKPRY